MKSLVLCCGLQKRRSCRPRVLRPSLGRFLYPTSHNLIGIGTPVAVLLCFACGCGVEVLYGCANYFTRTSPRRLCRRHPPPGRTFQLGFSQKPSFNNTTNHQPVVLNYYFGTTNLTDLYHNLFILSPLGSSLFK